MAIKDGLPQVVLALRLDVLSKHRMLHMVGNVVPEPDTTASTCHSSTATADPFATWHNGGNGLFNNVTKTWIYEPDGNLGWISHSSNGNASPTMGWNNIAFPAGCTY